jgi:cytochrome c
MKISFEMLGLAVLALPACTGSTTYVSTPDPEPVIGVAVIGNSGECIDVQDGATADGTPIIVFQCHGSPNERWFIKNGVISENFGSCLDVQGGAPIEGAPIILVACSGTSSQQWAVTKGQIIGLGGMCIAESGGSTADLTPLVLASCKAARGQWTVR